MFPTSVFLSDLLTTPPGLAHGMEFERKALGSSLKRPRAAGGVIHLSEIMGPEDEILFDNDDSVLKEEQAKPEEIKVYLYLFIYPLHAIDD